MDSYSLKDLPIGVEDYVSAVTNYYYVDKTQFIGDLLPAEGKVYLFTRPRRFGKTLTMSMLKTFFEISKEDTSVYFRDKKVWAMGERVTGEQGKYPVIFMTFKDARQSTWEKTYKNIEQALAREFRRHNELIESDRVDKGDLKDYMAIYNREADETTLSGAISLLAGMLYAHYGVKPIVLIDEYDAPIQAGYTNGYYDEVVEFVRDLFSNGLKTDFNVSFAVLTGILRVSKESIFSGLNNPVICTVLDEDYSQYFGFTLGEVKEMLEHFGCGDKIDEVLEWYDGYNFGGTEIFNPFSLVSYIGKKCKRGAYWVNTSGNGVLGDLLKKADTDMESKLARLLQGETIQSPVSENVVYADLDKRTGRNKNIFSILLFSGYLKAVGTVEKTGSDDPAYMAVMSDSNFESEGDDEEENDTEYLLEIPNREVRSIFRTEILDRMQVESDGLLGDIWSALKRSDAAALEELLRTYLQTAISVYDVGGSEISADRRANNEYEAFYHGMWLGFVAYKSKSYYIRSNRESGDGRMDLSLEPCDKRYPAMILEFKHLRDEDKTLQDKAKEALAQIDDRHYDADLRNRGYKNIIKAGIAYLGKNVAVAM